MHALDQLAARVDALESENRRLKKSWLAGVVAVGALLAVGFAAQDRSSNPNQFQQLLFTDEAGKPSGAVRVRKDGIVFSFGEGESGRAALWLSENGAVLKAYGKSGEAISGLGVGPMGITAAARSAKGTLVGPNALSNDTGNLLADDRLPREKNRR